jgi:hypothetical protein
MSLTQYFADHPLPVSKLYSILPNHLLTDYTQR